MLELRKKFLLVKSQHSASAGSGAAAGVDAPAMQEGVAAQPPQQPQPPDENKDADMLAAEAAAAQDDKDKVEAQTDSKRTMEEALAQAEQDFQKSKIQKTSGAESGG